jgi:hypothetical protein
LPNQYTKAEELGLPKPKWTTEQKDKARKKATGVRHSEATKEKLRRLALSSDHRRLRKNPQFYNGILMDSSWEVLLAKRLDHLEIEWIRPEPLIWSDANGVKHHYFPDFFLPKYNVYIDPKNPHAYKVQGKKINILKECYDNLVFLTSIKQIEEYSP